MFGREVLKPDLHRKPVYDSVDNRAGRRQSFVCAQCGTPISLDLELYDGDGEDPEVVLGPAHGAAVREHFGILEKSLENGWPYVRVEVCANCGASYLVYVAVFEPRNGWLQVVLQGITELVPSSDSPRRLDAERERQLEALGKAEVDRRSAELQAALDAANPAPIGSEEAYLLGLVPMWQHQGAQAVVLAQIYDSRSVSDLLRQAHREGLKLRTRRPPGGSFRQGSHDRTVSHWPPLRKSQRQLYGHLNFAHLGGREPSHRLSIEQACFGESEDLLAFHIRHFP